MSDLYEKARDLLRAQPQLGKNRLGAMLGVKAPTARRLRERFRGETLGHSHDPDYQCLRALKEQHPDWGAVRLASELAISLDHAKLHLSRWLGARTSGSVPGDKPPSPPPPETTATPPHPMQAARWRTTSKAMIAICVTADRKSTRLRTSSCMRKWT
jgi:hypothetical protein